MTGLLVTTGFITLLGVLAIYAGTDTRDGQDWRTDAGSWRPPHRPARPAEPAIGNAARRLPGAAGRSWRRQVAAWDRCLAAMQPWYAEPLRWHDGSGGPRLEGRIMPVLPPPSEGPGGRRNDEVGRRPGPSGPTPQPPENRRGLGLDSPG